MTCLISIGLSGAGMKLHTSMLGAFFVYTLGLSMPIFKKKSPRRFLGKCSKLCVLHNAFQASHCSALLMGCVKYCSRLYVTDLLILESIQPGVNCRFLV